MPVPLFSINDFITRYTPPNYRLPKWLTFVQSLCGGLTWRKTIFDAYRSGDPQAQWNSGATYGADSVVWWNYKTYQSLVSGNTANQPDISPAAWLLRCPSFIGATERTAAGSGYLPLTWALNRLFGATFRQPPYPSPYGGSGAFSDIYITTDAPVNVSFVMYPTDPPSSVMYPNTSAPCYLWNDPVYATATSYQYIIHMPAAIYSALGSTDPLRLAVMNNLLLNRVNMVGTSYIVETY